MSQAEGIPCF